MKTMGGSGGLAQHEPFGPQQMTPRVSLVAPARPAAADLPARAVVPARRAPHHHAIALVVQHRVVPADATDHLAEPANRSTEESICCLAGDLRRRCREPLGIVGHHGRFTLSSLYLRRTPVSIRP